jgi:uncharacterized protein YfaT (DUF1175 family)
VCCIPWEVAFQTRCHLAYPKKLGVVAHVREHICKNDMCQNVGKEKQIDLFRNFFTKIAYVQVMNFIPVKVFTLYRYTRFIFTEIRH